MTQQQHQTVTTRAMAQPIITEQTKAALKSSLHSRQIGILGGTFNPLHMGHLMMAEGVWASLGLDKILFIPDAEPPHKQGKTTIAAKDRLAMVRLGIADNPHFCVDDLEVRRGGKSYTIDTIKTLQERDPLAHYYLIIGADMVNDLPNWRAIDELVRRVTLVGIKRPGITVTTHYPVLWVDIPTIALSSTLIREKVAKGDSIRYLVPDAVAEYIKEHTLYD